MTIEQAIEIVKEQEQRVFRGSHSELMRAIRILEREAKEQIRTTRQRWNVKRRRLSRS